MKFKMFVVFLSFVFFCSDFAGEIFFSSAYAQDNKIVFKKQTSQKPAKKWRVVTLGEHGQFKGTDGFQMALNMAQDMDEIRIEKGTIEASGLIIPGNKEWATGIKISGGWNETFTEQSTNPDDTALVGNGNETDKSILNISNKKGSVFIENITFSNNNLSYNKAGGAVIGYGYFKNCIFNNNSGDSGGGAVYGGGSFTNCTFSNNSVRRCDGGGAVSGGGSFTNCTFSNNSTQGDGGAVSGGGSFTNCTFSNNSATGEVGGNSGYGGAVSSIIGKCTFNNCTFNNNSAKSNGGAIRANSSVFNCIFINNNAESAGAVTGSGSFTNCIFINNTSTKNGGAFYTRWDGSITFSNCTFFANKANESGGAFFGKGEVVNCIFYKNIASEQDNDITVDGSFKIDYSLFNNLTGVADIGPNNIMGDPKFIDSDNGNFTLASGSPCINKGKLLPSISRVQQKSKSGIAKKRTNMGANLDFKMIKDLLNTQSE